MPRCILTRVAWKVGNILTSFGLPKLYFSPETEAAYRRSILRRIVLVSRIGLSVGMIAIPAFIANDLLFDPDAAHNTLPVRLAIGLLNLSAFILLFTAKVQNSPSAIRAMFLVLFGLYSLGLVLIQSGHANGYLVNVPGYVQVMVFIPIISFSFLQAFSVTTVVVLVGIAGSVLAGASDVEMANLANWLVGSAAFALGASFVVDRVSRRSYELELELNEEKARADTLLLNILPEKIATRLKNKEDLIADYCSCVTVLFADISGFTNLSRGMQPATLVEMLNDLFSRFDRLAEKHKVEKIKTIGDGYMAVAGLSETRTPQQAASAVAAMALEMRDAFETFRQERGLDTGMRVGMHSGPVVAGVIGQRKFSFDLWGDTVNIASRIESSCPEGCIQMTRETRDLIGPEFVTSSRGMTELRGHAAREVFILEKRLNDVSDNGS